MSTSALLTSLFQYKMWANTELFACLEAMNEAADGADHHTAALILNHVYIVDSIFVANLQRRQHGFAATGEKEPPALKQLSSAVKKTDRWYIDYVSRLSSQELAEPIDFTFTDSALGRMTREEMLAHVITHGCYHRGEVSRIIASFCRARPPDIFTGYLHRTQPARRDPKT